MDTDKLFIDENLKVFKMIDSDILIETEDVKEILPFWHPVPEGFLYTPQETLKKKKLEKKLYRNYVDYAVLRLSNNLYIKVKKSIDTDNVQFVLERKNIFGKIVDTLSFTDLQVLEIFHESWNVFECRQRWRDYKGYINSNIWMLTSGNFVSFRQYKYNFFTSENKLVKTFTISFEQFELLYSYQDIFYTILPILKEKERCIFSPQGDYTK